TDPGQAPCGSVRRRSADRPPGTNPFPNILCGKILRRPRVLFSGLVQTWVTLPWPVGAFLECLLPPCWRGVPSQRHHTEGADMSGQPTALSAATQSAPGPGAAPQPYPARQLPPRRRQELALQVRAGARPVTGLARRHQVSRRFLYRQADTARRALEG